MTTATKTTARLASDAQIRFLVSLVKSKAHAHGDDATFLAKLRADDEDGRLTMRGASMLIDDLKRCPNKARPVASTPAPKATEGFYTSPDGKSHAKVQRAVHGSGNLYAKRFTANVDGDDASVEWVYESGLINRIAREGWARMDEATAMAFGKLYGVCMMCGRTLTNEESINLGIGPVCRGKLA